LSLSPNGFHIVFEIQDRNSYPSTSALWIMDRTNPVEIWPITDGGSYINPDWSRKDVVLDSDPDDDTPQNDNSSKGSVGGGGCFVSSCMISWISNT
jgi:hypothetical protein